MRMVHVARRRITAQYQIQISDEKYMHTYIFKPTLGVVCIFYDIRKPLFSLPKPNIELQKSSLKYVLSKLLNEEKGCIHYYIKDAYTLFSWI